MMNLPMNPTSGNFSDKNSFQGDRKRNQPVRPNSNSGANNAKFNRNQRSNNNYPKNSSNDGNQNNDSRIPLNQKSGSMRGRGGRVSSQRGRGNNNQNNNSNKPSSQGRKDTQYNYTNRNREAKSVDPPVSQSSTRLSGFESQYVGSFVPNPENFGFQKITRRTHGAPKYMLKENVLFDCSSFQQNEWDRKNQEMLQARETEYIGDPQTLFEEFQEYRTEERKMMEKFNLVDAENAKKSLNDAIIFRGSCYEMCPTYERVERTFKNQVSKWEKDPVTGKISKHYALKTFIRPSGQAPSLPSDVRPPFILNRTLNYIIDNLLTKLPEAQPFIWDRTRSIRQDFTFQNNYSGIESIECHEKICRIHILSLHVMAGANDPDYQQQQEVEQFNNSLQTLIHMYDDVRSKGGSCPNEAEFRAYELISKIRDTELDRTLQKLPKGILDSSVLQRALMLRGLILNGFSSLDLYSEFFQAVMSPDTHFLLSCLTEIHFNEVRYNFLKAISRSYHSKAKKLSVNTIASWLCFDSVDELLATFKLYEIPTVFEEGETRIEFVPIRSGFKFSQKQPYSRSLDRKVSNMAYRDIINCGFENIDLGLQDTKDLERIAKESFYEHRSSSQFIKTVLETSSGSSLPSSSFTSVNNGFVQSSLSTTPSTQPFGLNQHTPSSFTPHDSAKPLSSSGFNGFGGNNVSAFPSTHPVSQPLNSFPPIKPINPLGNQLGTINAASRTTSASNTNLFNPPSSSSTPSAPQINIEKNNESNPVHELPPELPKKKKLKEYKNYNDALKMVAKTMFVKAVGHTASGLIKESVNHIEMLEKKARDEKRHLVIDTLAEELFAAFMKEQIYLNVLKGKAEFFRQRKLGKLLIVKVKQVSDRLIRKQKILKAKREEVDLFSNKVIPMFAVNYQRNYTPNKIQSTRKEEQISSEFSSQFNVSELVCRNLPNINYVSILMNDFESLYSRWMINKFGLQNADQRYTRTVTVNKHVLHFSTSSKPPNTTYDADAVILESGLSASYKSDANVLSTIIGNITKCRSSKFTSILIVFFEPLNVSIPDDEVANILDLHKYENNSNISISLNVLPSFESISDQSDWHTINESFYNCLKNEFHKLAENNEKLKIQDAEAKQRLQLEHKESLNSLLTSDTKRNNISSSNTDDSMTSTASFRNARKSQLDYIKSTLTNKSTSSNRGHKRSLSNLRNLNASFATNNISLLSTNGAYNFNFAKNYNDTDYSMSRNSSFATTPSEYESLSKRKKKAGSLLKLTEDILH